jgi:hypothetical protein
MHKKALFLLLALFLRFFCYSQLPDKDSLFDYEKNGFHSTGGKTGPFIIAVLPNKLASYALYGVGAVKFTRFREKLTDSLYNDSIFRKKRLTYTVVQHFDSSKALVFVQGVNKQNAHEYEYRVLINNKENKNWKAFTSFYPYTSSSGFGENDPEMAFIGRLGTDWNNYLTIDVRKKNSDSVTSSLSIIRLSHPPKIIATYTAGELNNFFSLFALRSFPASEMIGNPKEKDYLKTRKEFSSEENNIIFYLDDLIKQRIIEYKLVAPSGSADWRLNNLDFNFI